MNEQTNTRVEETGIKRVKEFDKESWTPKTELGRKVKIGEIKTVNEILSKGLKILESEIIDILIPTLETELVSVGQSKGKFGGGKRSTWRQTQKKTQEGNKPKFSSTAIVGDKDGIVGLGFGKSRETVPAREKAIRNAKLNLIKIKRGCGSWEGDPKGNNSIPFSVTGKCGSVEIKLMPAPKGASLVIEKECAKMLRLAGIKDVYSRTSRNTKTKLNLIRACFAALKKISETKV